MPASKTPSRPSAGKAPGTDKRRPDWEAIERDYRTTRMTLRELEAAHGAAYATIGQRAKKEGWARDLAEVVRRATKAALIEDEVTKALITQATQGATQRHTSAVIEAVEVAKGVVLGHRHRSGRAVGVAMRMLDELDATTTHQDELRRLLAGLTDDMDDVARAQAQQQLQQFLRLHSRISSVHKLMDTLAKAQAMERQSFNIDGDDRGRDSDETMSDDTLRRKLARLGIAVNVPTIIDV